MYFEEIVEEIEVILDKLIENATLMQDISHIKEKILDFQKRQKGLLEHLHSMNVFLEKNKKVIKVSKEKQLIIANKMASFEKLNSNFIKNVSKNARLIKAKKTDNK
ncbi:MAG: hypothetical protein K940chlam1_01272 [Candidatus Anoxychlamydiales bacterium]|nr:hypothetical protein [Candidatus Anoxychlamydiales bacterium]NGX35319.1 hypothetical protein [Candidatus Anoxychlamydiales bacterium]